ncbi:unknown [Methanoculleus sp. CAG:1088]|nr:unknown [Methanoculleus sp. CAG:1088]
MIFRLAISHFSRTCIIFKCFNVILRSKYSIRVYVP